MKTITEYLINNHVKNTKEFGDVSLDHVNFKYFCNLKYDDKADILGNNKASIVQFLNASEHAADYNSNFTIEFKDGYLHIGAYYEVAAMAIYTAYLFSAKQEFPDTEWADCDWRGEIKIAETPATKLWLLCKDLTDNADELIKHKLN